LGNGYPGLTWYNLIMASYDSITFHPSFVFQQTHTTRVQRSFREELEFYELLNFDEEGEGNNVDDSTTVIKCAMTKSRPKLDRFMSNVTGS
jgi:hypothetical protein